ncbi:MAG: HD domain-containing protein [Candidatus Thermoplasmatota archaeon]|nr:HD domain-containing protein [Candidatus Thermoplasmatota archaeon]
MAGKHKVIRDSIHGDIKLSAVFSELIETPELQRLYNIKQLGLAHLVFPGAHHTRLEHSLGAYHLAYKTADALGLDTYEKELVGIAGLLHDVGHGPFSHTLESILRTTFGVDHVDLTEQLILGKYDVFFPDEKDFTSVDCISDVLENYDVDPVEVVKIIRGNGCKKRYLCQILNSAIDVDQLDYIIRDGYYTGVAYGTIDIERYLNTLMIKDGNYLAISKKGISVVESIFMARLLMYSSVYFHKTVRIAELMLSKAIELLYGKEPFDFFKMTDSELINDLKRFGAFQNKIVTCLKYRKLFKQAYVASSGELQRNQIEKIKALENREARFEKEHIIEESLNIPRGHVIIDVPRMEIHQAEPRLDLTDINVIDKDESRQIDTISPITMAIKTRSIPDWIVMIITDERYRDLVAKQAEDLLFS